MIKKFSSRKSLLHLLFLQLVTLFVIAQSTACYAESAIEIIRRTTKNPALKVAAGVATLSQKERDAQTEKAKALAVELNAAEFTADIKPARLGVTQRVDEIIVQAELEPEDVVPEEKTPFQKMRAKLDSVGKSAPMIIAEAVNNDGSRTTIIKRNGGCYAMKSNAGRMNLDGTLGSRGNTAMSCTGAEAAAK